MSTHITYFQTAKDFLSQNKAPIALGTIAWLGGYDLTTATAAAIAIKALPYAWNTRLANHFIKQPIYNQISSIGSSLTERCIEQIFHQKKPEASSFLTNCGSALIAGSKKKIEASVNKNLIDNNIRPCSPLSLSEKSLIVIANTYKDDPRPTISRASTSILNAYSSMFQ